MGIVNSKVYNLFNLIIPQSVPINKIRLGRDKDGGYIVPKNIMVDALLSYGIGDDISFEIDFISTFHKPVYGFDKELILESNNPLLFLFQQTITGGNDIKEHKNQFCLEDKNLAIKMDIEHDEWEVLDDTHYNNISYIVVELHGLLDKPHNHELMKRVLNRINKHFICTHVHANNFGNIRYFGGKYFPDVLEVLYVSKKMLNLKIKIRNENTFFPTSLDKPNNPVKPDIQCHWWCYSPNKKQI